MKQEMIKFNGTSLLVTVDPDGTPWIAVKQVMEAIGLNVKSGVESLKNDEILGPATALRRVLDGQNRMFDMLCLPLHYFNGWLFSIQVSRVSDEAKENLLTYKRECYNVLFQHFYGSGKKVHTNTVELYKVDQDLRFAKAETKRWKSKVDHLEQRKAELLKDNYIQYRLFEDAPMLENAEFEETE